MRLIRPRRSGYDTAVGAAFVRCVHRRHSTSSARTQTPAHPVTRRPQWTETTPPTQRRRSTDLPARRRRSTTSPSRRRLDGTAPENQESGNEAIGAGAGALGGAAVGMAVGGPPGAVVGGAIGAVGGAVAGEATEGDDEAGVRDRRARWRRRRRASSVARSPDLRVPSSAPRSGRRRRRCRRPDRGRGRRVGQPRPTTPLSLSAPARRRRIATHDDRGPASAGPRSDCLEEDDR